MRNITKLKDIDTTEFDAVLVAYENEEHNMLKTELQKLERKIKSNNSSEQQYNIAIVIGPEGGISEKELVMLAEKNAKFVSLGKRILRTETAGVVITDCLHTINNIDIPPIINGITLDSNCHVISKK